MKVYKIQAEENGTALYCKKWNDVESYMGDQFSLVMVLEMDEKTFKQLPEFSGF
jgi:hypothetical protein